MDKWHGQIVMDTLDSVWCTMAWAYSPDNGDINCTGDQTRGAESGFASFKKVGKVIKTQINPDWSSGDHGHGGEVSSLQC